MGDYFGEKNLLENRNKKSNEIIYCKNECHFAILDK
jgi:hypothetical protein